MSITFCVENVEFDLPEKLKIKKWISEVIKKQNKVLGSINYLFTNDENVLKTNIEFLNHDTYTDIITFDYVEGSNISGDIMISIDRVRDNASQFSVPFEQELHRVVIHGVLHLLGQGDKTPDEAKEMRRKEEEALRLWEDMN